MKEELNQEILDQIQEEADLRMQLAVQRQNLIGRITNWRKMKSNPKVEKLLNGRAKILNLVLR